MKVGIATVMAFIQVIVLISVVNVVGEERGFSNVQMLLSIIGCVVIGLIPVVRAFALLGLMLLLFKWWVAILITIAAVLVMQVIDGIGTAILKREAQR